jgi:hypothetical protein
MPTLRDQHDDLAALVATTADALGIDAGFVEKDFWVIEVLRAATAPVQVAAKDGSRHAVQTIFKGGTSLSRAYGLIERFSEDVDLLVSFPPVEIGTGSRDKVLKAIRDAVAAHLRTIGVQVGVTAGIKRNIRYAYPARYGSAGITEGVLLEMGSRGGAFPTHQHQLRSLVADHAIDVLGETDDAWEEFDPVSVAVLAPERTLLEKLALLHDGVSRYPSDKARAKLLTGGRHLYDVHKLLNSRAVVAALNVLGPDGVARLCQDIDEHSENADFSYTPRQTTGYGASPLLDPDTPAFEPLRAGYISAMNLVYGPRPTIEQCLQTIQTRAVLL